MKTAAVEIYCCQYRSIPIGRILHFGLERLKVLPKAFGMPSIQMLSLAYLVKYHTVNVKNRVRSPKTTNATWCNRQHVCLPPFLGGKHKTNVFSSNLGVAQ